MSLDTEAKRVRYAELNKRARAYSGQLWYVPFAYVGLLGAGLTTVDDIPRDLQGLAFIFLGLFSLAVFVHVASVKYYQRRAVKAMRRLEGDNPVSEGGSPWYLSFSWFMRLLLLGASYTLIVYGTAESTGNELITLIVLGFTVVLFAWIAWKDRKRNKELIKSIRDEDE